MIKKYIVSYISKKYFVNTPIPSDMLSPKTLDRFIVAKNTSDITSRFKDMPWYDKYLYRLFVKTKKKSTGQEPTGLYKQGTDGTLISVEGDNNGS